MLRLFASRICAASTSSAPSKSRRLPLLVAGIALAGALSSQFETPAQAGPYSRQAIVPSMAELAAEYRAVVNDMDQFQGMSYGSLAEVRRTRTALSKYDPDAVSKGWFAYHALMVSRDDKFHTAVNKMVEEMGMDTFLRLVDRNPAFLRHDPAMRRAVSVITDAINDETARLAAMHTLVEARMKDFHADRTGKDMSSGHSRQTTPADLKAKYVRTAGAPNARANPVIDRVLALAARRSVNAVEGANAPVVVTLASESSMNRCVRFSKLNLDQCIAAARFPEEEAMCVGRFGFGELGKCWSWMLDS